MIYIVYWVNDYKRAIDSLAKHAVCGKIRYVPCNKPYLLPDVMKRFELGLNGNLLALCVSDVVYDRFSWRKTFGSDMEIEKVSFGSDANESEFMEWFNYHISPFDKTVRGGVVRHVVKVTTRSYEEDYAKRDKTLREDFFSEIRSYYQRDADDVMMFCLHQVGMEYGNWLADKQDEWLVMNKDMMIKWTKLEYYQVNGRLTDRGYEELANVRDRIKMFIRDYVSLFYRTENSWFDKFMELYKRKIFEYAANNGIEVEFLVPSRKLQLSTLREWLEVEYPKERPGYFVMPLWFNESLVRKTLLSRVMPWEQHLRNLATMSPAPKSKVVFPSSHQ